MDATKRKSKFPSARIFNEFNDASLNILFIYRFHPSDCRQFQAFRQKVNPQRVHAFEEEGIDFAFPTQTVYLENDNKRQLALRMLGEDMSPGL
jgi:MscS family membrane protein